MSIKGAVGPTGPGLDMARQKRTHKRKNGEKKGGSLNSRKTGRF
jgi:hypothetical protein